MSVSIDLNADVGESFGVYRLGDDEALLRVITSANIACGMHAGDPQVMRETVRMALHHGVRIGAHPGYADLQGFGRRAMALSIDELVPLILYQIGALQALTRSLGGRVTHVKMHGALYHHVGYREEVARAVTQALGTLDRNLIVFAPVGSPLVSIAEEAGLGVCREAFADRPYEADGTLTPRSVPGSVRTVQAAVQAALGIIRDGVVEARTGERIPMTADTFCVHGDTPGAAQVARQLRDGIEVAGTQVNGYMVRSYREQ